eukprot:g23731.t1
MTMDKTISYGICRRPPVFRSGKLRSSSHSGSSASGEKRRPRSTASSTSTAARGLARRIRDPDRPTLNTPGSVAASSPAVQSSPGGVRQASRSRSPEANAPVQEIESARDNVNERQLVQESDMEDLRFNVMSILQPALKKSSFEETQRLSIELQEDGRLRSHARTEIARLKSEAQTLEQKSVEAEEKGRRVAWFRRHKQVSHYPGGHAAHWLQQQQAEQPPTGCSLWIVENNSQGEACWEEARKKRQLHGDAKAKFIATLVEGKRKQLVFAQCLRAWSQLVYENHLETARHKQEEQHKEEFKQLKSKADRNMLWRRAETRASKAEAPQVETVLDLDEKDEDASIRMVEAPSSTSRAKDAAVRRKQEEQQKEAFHDPMSRSV